VEGGTNQVQLLANYIEVLYQSGDIALAREQFQNLRGIGGRMDLDLPVIKRLRHLIRELELPEDWRLPSSRAGDVGERPELSTLGPFRWEPPEAPDWALPDPNGNLRSLQDFEGKPVLLIFYLGHGCIHCIEQLNLFSPVAGRFAEAGIALAAISTDSVEGLQRSLEKAAEEQGFAFPLLSDESLEVFKRYRAYDDFEQMPLHGTFLIDGAGRVRWQDISYEPFQQTEFLLQECRRLLEQPLGWLAENN
jgi:peroxiredoxin